MLSLHFVMVFVHRLP